MSDDKQLITNDIYTGEKGMRSGELKGVRGS